MIATLSGIIQKKSPGYAIIETCGVGYGVTLPLSSYYNLPEKGESVFLNIHTHVREDSFSLFGFLTDEEKDMFEKLNSISGIGPRLAINILSGISVSDLIRAIESEDIQKITSIPGIGKKMSGRIILELKDKLKKVFLAEDINRGSGISSDSFASDAESALISLGYKPAVAKESVQKAMKSFDRQLELEDLIKISLKFLSRP